MNTVTILSPTVTTSLLPWKPPLVTRHILFPIEQEYSAFKECNTTSLLSIDTTCIVFENAKNRIVNVGYSICQDLLQSIGQALDIGSSIRCLEQCNDNTYIDMYIPYSSVEIVQGEYMSALMNYNNYHNDQPTISIDFIGTIELRLVLTQEVNSHRDSDTDNSTESSIDSLTSRYNNDWTLQAVATSGIVKKVSNI